MATVVRDGIGFHFPFPAGELARGGGVCMRRA
jgi:hypothetical protein